MDKTTAAQQANDKHGDFSPVQLRRRQKFARSRDGCYTCKQRKVKCDEQRPRCSHCERLNIECKWQGTPRSAVPPRQPSTVGSDERGPTRTPRSGSSAGLDNASGLPPHQAQDPQGIPQIFDYSSFFWEGTDVWQQMCVDADRDMDPENQMMVGATTGRTAELPINTLVQDTTYDNQSQTGHNNQIAALTAQTQATGFGGSGAAAAATVTDTSGMSTRSDNSPYAARDTIPLDSTDNQGLIDYFTHSVVPPILSEVEAQKNWNSMRKIMIKMAAESRMVRLAVLAFSNAILCRQNNDWTASQQHHYENATAEIVQLFNRPDSELVAQHSVQRENMFATLFFLSYVDILEARVEAAHSHLQRAYTLFQKGKNERFAPMEKQLLLWIRLLDARTVAAGGEGLFLSKNDEEILVLQTSPASFGGEGEEVSKEEFDDNDVEDILFQALYQPGITFFQKVQSFMGHIAKIDPWHRSRGTVQDETEVMSTAATISADLRALYEQRPALMDCAVAGKLTTRHISPGLALPLTRAFRTYLSNYYASKIHLHRVAYKTFPLTTEAVEALGHIRRLAKLISENLEGEEDPLPINMLWPLLLMGTEEQDLNERAWIKTQILRMEKIAGNARITAQVLEELQGRQDATKMRVDIGTVMREMFNIRFAVV